MTRQQFAIRAAQREKAAIKAARMAEYNAALHPKKEAVTQDVFDQIVADATYTNRENMAPGMVLEWARKRYVIVKETKEA